MKGGSQRNTNLDRLLTPDLYSQHDIASMRRMTSDNGIEQVSIFLAQCRYQHK